MAGPKGRLDLEKVRRIADPQKDRSSPEATLIVRRLLMDDHIRKLQFGDEQVLQVLAIQNPDFDVEGRGKPLEPLSDTDARAFLKNDDVLYWVAFEDSDPVGFLYCISVPLRASPGRELLLYEIGTRKDRRNQGVGTSLTMVMRKWMEVNKVKEVWVIADTPGAVNFYISCGFDVSDEASMYMVMET